MAWQFDSFFIGVSIAIEVDRSGCPSQVYLVALWRIQRAQDGLEVGVLCKEAPAVRGGLSLQI